MVTVRNSTNEAFYLDLFEAANACLVEFKTDYPSCPATETAYDSKKYQKLVNGVLTDVPYSEFKVIYEEVEAISAELGENGINTLEDYFSVLKTLSLGFDTNFQILPAPQDEPNFIIDLNTRSIKPPENNFTYAVMGDEMAETIYFESHRYFDNVDLNDMDIAFLVNTGKKKYLIPSSVRDVTSDESKIIFGWPISKEITEDATTLEFSVRFYKYKDGSNTLEYSLSTQPETLMVKKSLNYLKDAEDVDSLTSVSDRAANLLKNYDKLGTAAVPAPVIYFCSYPDVENGSANLNTDNTLILFASSSSNADSLVGSWKKLNGSNAPIDLPTSEGYYKIDKITKEDIEKSNVFYVYDEDATPSYASIVLVEPPSSSDTTEYYRKGDKAIATTSGEYYYIATAKSTLREKSSSTKILEIPAPQKLIFTDDDKKIQKTFMLTNSKSSISSSDINTKYNKCYTNTETKYIGTVEAQPYGFTDPITTKGTYDIKLKNTLNNDYIESDAATLTVYDIMKFNNSDFIIKVGGASVDVDSTDPISVSGDPTELSIQNTNYRSEVTCQYVVLDSSGKELEEKKGTINNSDEIKIELSSGAQYTLRFTLSTSCLDFAGQPITSESKDIELFIKKVAATEV